MKHPSRAPPLLENGSANLSMLFCWDSETPLSKQETRGTSPCWQFQNSETWRQPHTMAMGQWTSTIMQVMSAEGFPHSNLYSRFRHYCLLLILKVNQFECCSFGGRRFRTPACFLPGARSVENLDTSTKSVYLEMYPSRGPLLFSFFGFQLAEF